MRVLQINLAFWGGGAERCARELFEHLPARGVTTEFWAAHPPDPAIPGVRILPQHWASRLPLLGALPHLTDWRHYGAGRALSMIEPGQFDIVHLHNFHGAVPLRAVYELCQRQPTVWTLHDQWAAAGTTGRLDGLMSPQEVKQLTPGLMRHIPYHPYHDNFRVRSMNRLLDRWAPQPALMISPSHHLKQQVESSGRYAGVPIRVIRNGVALLDRPRRTMPQAEARAELGIAGDHLVVLMVAAGLAQPHKGMALGLDAIKRVAANRRATDPPLTVLLVGHQSKALRAQLGQIYAVTTVARTDDELAACYRAADVTLIPSLVESLSYVALESMSCERPVATFRVGGIQEVCGQEQERGLLATPFQIVELADSLHKLLQSPALRRTLAENGCAWVRANCQMPHYLKQVAKSYADAVEHRP